MNEPTLRGAQRTELELLGAIRELRAELRQVRRAKRKQPSIGRVRKKLGTQPKAKPWRKDRDLEAMKRLKDPRSYIRLDGSEVLYGEDWRERVAELRKRSDGRCEYEKCPAGPSDAPMDRCYLDACDPHHKTRRSIRRDDRLSNLQHLCRGHHIALDPRQIRSAKVR